MNIIYFQIYYKLSTEKKNKNKTNKQKQKINAKQNQTIDNI
jgi:hypothetical protein